MIHADPFYEPPMLPQSKVALKEARDQVARRSKKRGKADEDEESANQAHGRSSGRGKGGRGRGARGGKSKGRGKGRGQPQAEDPSRETLAPKPKKAAKAKAQTKEAPKKKNSMPNQPAQPSNRAQADEPHTPHRPRSPGLSSSPFLTKAQLKRRWDAKQALQQLRSHRLEGLEVPTGDLKKQSFTMPAPPRGDVGSVKPTSPSSIGIVLSSRTFYVYKATVAPELQQFAKARLV